MFENLITDDIKNLIPYTAGTPIEEVQDKYGLSDVIKLASNENPLGPSPLAIQAIAGALARLNRYPESSGIELRTALADHLKLNADNITLGNGSDEIIELCVRAFLRPGENVVLSYPTFTFYAKVVQAAGGRITQVPLNNFEHDLNRVSKSVTENTKLIFIDSPNNPSGSLVPADDLKTFINDLPGSTVLVLDEAYRDFVRGEDVLDPEELIKAERPIIFLRTFSKAYGLAGLRIGYGIAHPELTGYLDRIRQPFNIGNLATIGAIAALKDIDFYKKTMETTWSGLDWLWAKLTGMGLKYRKTHTNYFLIEVGADAGEITEKLMAQGVIVRSMESYGLKNTIRLTVGIQAENERFISALKKVLG